MCKRTGIALESEHHMEPFPAGQTDLEKRQDRYDEVLIRLEVYADECRYAGMHSGRLTKDECVRRSNTLYLYCVGSIKMMLDELAEVAGLEVGP